MSLDLRFHNLVEALYFEAKVAGPAHGVTFIDDAGSETVVRYLEALEEAALRAAALQARGVERGEPVPVLIPTSPEFLYVFFGLLLAGAIPAPLAPPAQFGDIADFAERVGRTARYLGARRVIAAEGVRDLLAPALSGVELVAPEALATEGAALRAAYRPADVAAGEAAYIQCTSGSTGQPKGVVLSHENLISNVYQIGWCLDVRSTDVPVCWLPLYHDMGIIGCLLFSIYWNLSSVFLSPFRFLRRPATWLQAIARHRGSISPAPNFAYNYVTARARDEDLAGVDLSSWRVAACGAEPIDARALERFQARFARFGLPANAPTPCYGLAEATLAVTFHACAQPLRVDRLARAPLAERGLAVDAAPGEPSPVEVVSCGRPLPETRVRVLGEDGAPLPEGRVGRVQVIGPSVMKGYLALPAETAAALADGWLDTGDLGYLRGGELRITGRAKDLVIIRGRNYAPTDFEWAAEEVAGVRKGNAVAFGVYDPAQGTEGVVLVCETDVADDAAREALEKAVRANVSARTAIAPAAVELVPRDTVPKTTSGKLQRGKMKALYVAARAPCGRA